MALELLKILEVLAHALEGLEAAPALALGRAVLGTRAVLIEQLAQLGTPELARAGVGLERSKRRDLGAAQAWPVVTAGDAVLGVTRARARGESRVF